MLLISSYAQFRFILKLWAQRNILIVDMGYYNFTTPNCIPKLMCETFMLWCDIMSVHKKMTLKQEYGIINERWQKKNWFTLPEYENE